MRSLNTNGVHTSPTMRGKEWRRAGYKKGAPQRNKGRFTQAVFTARVHGPCEPGTRAHP